MGAVEPPKELFSTFDGVTVQPVESTTKLMPIDQKGDAIKAELRLQLAPRVSGGAPDLGGDALKILHRNGERLG